MRLREPGMSEFTLRDLFAAAALAGVCVEGEGSSPVVDDFKAARYCYGLADAMLKEREKRNE